MTTQSNTEPSTPNTDHFTQFKTENFEYRLRLLRHQELSLLSCETKPLTPFPPQTFVFILDATGSMNQSIDKLSRFDTLMRGIKMTIRKLMPAIEADLFRNVTISIKTFNYQTHTVLCSRLTKDLALQILAINEKHGLTVDCEGITDLNLIGELVDETRGHNTTIIGATDGQHTVRHIGFNPGSPCDYMIGIGQPDKDFEIESLKRLTKSNSVLIASTASDLSSSILGLFNSFRPNEKLQIAGETLYHLPLGDISYTLFIGDDLVTIGANQYQLKSKESDLVEYFKGIKELQEAIAEFEKGHPTPTEVQNVCSQFGVKAHLLKQKESNDPDEKRIITMFHTLQDRLHNIYRQAFIEAYGFDCGGFRLLQRGTVSQTNRRQVMVSAINGNFSFASPQLSDDDPESLSLPHESLDSQRSLFPVSSATQRSLSLSPVVDSPSEPSLNPSSAVRYHSPTPLSTPQISTKASQRMTEAALISSVAYNEELVSDYDEEFQCAICLCGFFDLSPTTKEIRSHYNLPVPETPHCGLIRGLSGSFASYESQFESGPSSIGPSHEVEIPSFGSIHESSAKEPMDGERSSERNPPPSYDLMARFVDIDNLQSKAETVDMEVDSQATIEIKDEGMQSSPEEDKVKLCRHLFHTKCFKRWAHSVRGLPTCPICRTSGGKMELLVSPPNGKCISCQKEIPSFYCLSCKKLAYCKNCVKDRKLRMEQACCENQVKFSEIRRN